MDILFSIIIPTYNRADFIAKTIASVLAQQYANFELLVVDDGSTDNTEAVVNKISDRRLTYYKKENAERGAARNFGAKLAKGEYVTFFDSDDLLLPHHLTTALDAVQRLNRPEVFHLNYETADADGHKLSEGPVYATPEIDRNLLAKGNPFSCNGVFLRKDVADNFRFNEDRQLSASEDYELWLRIISHYPVFMINTITSVIIVHDARSVLTTNEQKLVKRKNLFLFYALSDPKVQEVFGSKRHMLESFADTYVSLHLILAGDVRRAWHYLHTAFVAYPACIFDRRSFAILKYTLIFLFKRKTK